MTTLPQHRARRHIWHEWLYIYRFSCEFLRSVRIFKGIPRCVSIFGSARLEAGHPDYQLAVELSQQLASAGIGVFTGGGPGIMEAANRGAQSVGGLSIGCSIHLPHETCHNEFITLGTTFRYFFSRKMVLTRYSSGFVGLPGGFGTLDEICEIMTLMKTERMPSFPVVLMNTSFWTPFLDFLKIQCVEHGTISSHEFDNLLVTDDVSEAVAHLLSAAP